MSRRSLRATCAARTVRTFCGEGEVRERLGRLGCVAFALMLGIDAISDLDDAIGRRPFEAATADGAAGIAMHDGKAVPPRIDGSEARTAASHSGETWARSSGRIASTMARVSSRVAG